MRLFAVLGNPIEHSKSPEIHRAFAKSCRHDIDYQRVLVEAGDFDRVVTEFFASGGIGLNVTAPFKGCLLYTSPSPRDQRGSRMPSSA